MKLKHAILEVLSRDDLKKICKDFDVEGVDQRSIEAMTAKLSRAHRATAEKLIVYLSEAEVREVAERVGAVVRGRRTELIEALLRRERAYPGAGTAEPSDAVQDRERTAASADIPGLQIEDGPAGLPAYPGRRAAAGCRRAGPISGPKARQKLPLRQLARSGFVVG